MDCTTEQNLPPEVEKKVSRLGDCEVCAIEPAKYTCPKCELKTCCLNCVNIHKRELECDGIRNKVKFIPLQKFSNLELQNDFNLLEEVSNSLFKYKRDPVKNSVSMYNKLPHPLHILRKYAYMRKTQVKFLPKLFTQHKINTSCVYKNNLYWRVEWVFVSGNLKHVDEKLIDSTRLCIPLTAHLDQPDLAFYKAAGINGLLILMKAERSSKFYILDHTLSIAENLKNKCIIEFPIFYVIFNYEKDMFDIEYTDVGEAKDPRIQSHSQIENGPKEKLDHVKQTEGEDVHYDCFENEGSIDVSSEDTSEIIVEPRTITDDSEYSSISYEYDY